MANGVWNNMPWYLKNRYTISLLVFFLWMGFFDQHNIINQLKLKRELYQLHKDQLYYSEEIIKIREDMEELLSDNSKLEKFAREKYFMKRPSEEIFVFVEEN